MEAQYSLRIMELKGWTGEFLPDRVKKKKGGEKCAVRTEEEIRNWKVSKLTRPYGAVKINVELAEYRRFQEKNWSKLGLLKKKHDHFSVSSRQEHWSLLYQEQKGQSHQSQNRELEIERTRYRE